MLCACRVSSFAQDPQRMEGCSPINDDALCSDLFVSFAVLAHHLSRSLAPARDKEAKSGDGARTRDANRMIGVALSTIGLGPWTDRGKASVWSATGAKPRCRIHGPEAGCNGMLAILRAATVELRDFGAAGCVRDADEVVVKKCRRRCAATALVFCSGTMYSHRQYRGYLLPLRTYR